MPTLSDQQRWLEREKAKLRDVKKGFGRRPKVSREERMGIRSTSPLDYAVRKVDEPGEKEPKYGWADQNALYDFLGNAVWGFGETFLAPTIADIYSEATGGPDISSEYFGSQDWKDESLSGKAGYMLGTAAGIYTGIGAVGTVLGMGSRLGGAGMKAAVTELTEQGAKLGTKNLTDDLAREVINTTRKSLRDAGKAQLKTKGLKWGEKRVLKKAPQSDFIVQSTVRENLEGIVTNKFKFGTDAIANKQKSKLIDLIMKTSGESLHKNFGHSISTALRHQGVNKYVSQLAGDALYEATLLGIWDTVVGEVGGDLVANLYGLHDIDPHLWEDEAWYKRAMHGMVTGSILSTLRFIPGGKLVQLGKSGMVADAMHLKNFIMAKFRTKGRRLTDDQLKAFHRSMITSSEGVAYATGVITRSHAEGLTPKLFDRMISYANKNGGKLKEKHRELLEKVYDKVRGELPRHMGRLVKDIARDGFGSFGRASAGSFAMNFSAYKQAKDYGYLFPKDAEGQPTGEWFTEDYPLSKLIADHWVGMLYMKRGKRFEGHGTMPVFYDGGEVSRIVESFRTLGRKESDLGIIGRLHLSNNTQTAAERFKIKIRNENVRKLTDEIDSHVVSKKELLIRIHERQKEIIEESGTTDRAEINRLLEEKGLQRWDFQIGEESKRLSREIDRLRIEDPIGNKEAIENLQFEITRLQEDLAIVNGLIDVATEKGATGVIKPMDRATALEWLRTMRNVKYDGGSINAGNIIKIKEEVLDGKLLHTKEVQDKLESYIKESLESLGIVLNDKGELNRSGIMKLLGDIRSQYGKEYYDPAVTLIDALYNAETTEMIKFSKAGIIPESVLNKQDRLEAFKKIWENYTETFHEEVFNDGSWAPSWREGSIPGWSGKEKEKEFFDPHILAQDPFWVGIQTGRAFARNKSALHQFTSRGSTEGLTEYARYLQKKVGDASRIRLIGERKEGERAEELVVSSISESERMALRNYNEYLRLTSPVEKEGITRDMTLSEFTSFMKEGRKEFGNLFENLNNFEALRDYTHLRLIKDITGNALLTFPLRKLISLQLEYGDQSLLTIKGKDQLIFRDAESLRASVEAAMVKGQVTREDRDSMHRLIDEYEATVVRPLNEAFEIDKGVNGKVKIGSNIPLDLTLEANKFADLKQSIAESILIASDYKLVEVGHMKEILINASVNVEEIVEGVKKLKENGQFKESEEKNTETIDNQLKDLINSGQRLSDMFEIYLRTNDIIGLRYLLESKGHLENFVNSSRNIKPGDSKAIIEYTNLLREYVREAFDKRNNSLKLDDIQSVDDWLDIHTGNTYRMDRSHRPTVEGASITPQQYESKYNMKIDFIKDLTEEPKKALRMAGVLPEDVNEQTLYYITHNLSPTKLKEALSSDVWTGTDYMNQVVIPIAEKVLPKILKDKTVTENNFPKDTSENEMRRQFIMDTMFVIQTALNSRKFSFGTISIADGKESLLTLSEKSISVWDRGVNRLSKDLGLIAPGSMIILGERKEIDGRWVTILNEETRIKLEEGAKNGVGIHVDGKSIITKEDYTILKNHKKLVGGQGKDGRVQFVPITLDNKTEILIPTVMAETIYNAWNTPGTPLRVALIQSYMKSWNAANPNNRKTYAGAEKTMEEFFKVEYEAAYDAQNKTITFNTERTAENIRSLVLLTRTLAERPDRMAQYIHADREKKEELAVNKYIAMSSPRGGFPITRESIEVADVFLNHFKSMEGMEYLVKAHETFREQLFEEVDGVRQHTKHRTINIFDEFKQVDLVGEEVNHFSSLDNARVRLTEQMLTQNQDTEFVNKKGELTKKGEERLEQNLAFLKERVDGAKIGGEDASNVNAMKWLSLPEMTTLLLDRGAKRDWFILDVNNNIIGFNKVIKPIEGYSDVGWDESGNIKMTVHIGKTAYVYDPTMDNMMKRNPNLSIENGGNRRGNYWIDSMGFESAHKAHKRTSRLGEMDLETPGVRISANDRITHDNWKQKIGEQLNETAHGSEVVEIDREGILIRSITSEHDAILSVGFSNFLSNDATGLMAGMSKTSQTKNDMLSHYYRLSQDPLAYRDFTSGVLNYQHKEGDTMGRLLGIEQILAAGGIPVYEYLLPHVDRMVASEYMTNRNATSSLVESGAYSNMSAGVELSLPVREGNVQYAFGGSGKSYYEWSKPIFDQLFTLGEGPTFKPKDSETFSFIFKVNKPLIEYLNTFSKSKKGDKEGFFDRLLKIGDDILVTGDGMVISPHVRITPNEFDANRRTIKAFEDMMLDNYTKIVELVNQENSLVPGSFENVGDLAHFLNGTIGRELITVEGQTMRAGKVLPDRDYSLNASLNNKKTHNRKAIYNKLLDSRNRPLFQSVHLEAVDQRTPHIGINDWVITRIEKLIDRRRGPVSEMNYMDVINPHDADHDLDKSTSLHRLPGKVLNEIYHVSGYISSPEEVFNTISNELVRKEGGSVAQQKDLINKLESQRAPIMRAVSTLSTLIQMRTAAASGKDYAMFKAGERLNEAGFNNGYSLVLGMNNKAEKFHISLREGVELIDSIQHVKSLIKATIDVYKRPQDIADKDLVDLVWREDGKGIIKIVDPYGNEISPRELQGVPGMRDAYNDLIHKVLPRIGDIHNIALMTETDGAKKRMLTSFEMAYKFDKILSDFYFMSQKEYGKNNIRFLGDFLIDLRRHLGMTERKDGDLVTPGLDVSKSPFIQALIGLRKSFSKFVPGFSGNYKDPKQLGLASFISAEAPVGERLDKAIRGVLNDSKRTVEIQAISFRREQINDIISSLRRKGDTDGSAYKYWETELANHDKILSKYYDLINAPSEVYKRLSNTNKVRKARKLNQDKYGKLLETTDVYQEVKVGGEIEVKRTRYNRGDNVSNIWIREGSVIQENPIKIEAGNSFTNRIRTSMFHAFGRRHVSVTEGEFWLLKDLKKNFMKEIRNNQVADHTTITSMGEKAALDYMTLGDYFKKAGNIRKNNSKDLQENFIWLLLTPEPNSNVYNIGAEYDVKNRRYRYEKSFFQNKSNERLVFHFLGKGMNGEASSFIDRDTAKEIHQTINNRFKTALVHAYDRTLQGDVFRFEKEDRPSTSFRLVSPLKELPAFVFNTDLNEVSKDILVAYATGTYFLDPVSLYRITVNSQMIGTTSEVSNHPHPKNLESRIKSLWRGSKIKQMGHEGQWFEPESIYRSRMYYNEKTYEDMMEGLRKHKNALDNTDCIQ